jgi:hypothetical protein
MKAEHMYDLMGWLGAIEVLLAYFLVSLDKIKSDSPSYQWLNLTGAIFLIVNTLYKEAYPSTFVNVIWVGIAFFMLVKGKKS